jgi:hypothetical protein
MVIVTKKSELAKRLEELRTPMPLTKLPSDQNVAIKPASIIPATVAAATKQSHYMYVKTNLVGLALLNANVGIEFDLGNYLSFNLPVSYSAVNYFTPTIKFRNFSIQPELRVWPMKNNDGLFIGAHAGFAYFNFALGKNSAYRYQDAGGTKPAMGGGLNVGYRMPLSKKHPRWKVEFSLGAGVYDVNYDKFINENGGLKVQGTFHKTAIAVDNVGVSFSYSFDIKKRNR